MNTKCAKCKQKACISPLCRWNIAECDVKRKSIHSVMLDVSELYIMILLVCCTFKMTTASSDVGQVASMYKMEAV